MTRNRSFKPVLALGAALLAMMTLAPVSFAGEDDDEDAPAATHKAASSGGGGGGGGSDSGSAKGGVQTGFGGMSATDDGSLLIPLGLASGGILVLSAAGALSRRRVLEQ
jgi:hypothetical protein